MAAAALPKDATLDDVRTGLAGNICRCTGYTAIYRAVEARAGPDEGFQAPGRPALAGQVAHSRGKPAARKKAARMRTAISTLELVEPRSLKHALEVLRDRQPIVPLAGGTDIYVLLNAGTPPGARYLNLWGLDALRGIDGAATVVSIGALTTFSEIMQVARRPPARADRWRPRPARSAPCRSRTAARSAATSPTARRPATACPCWPSPMPSSCSAAPIGVRRVPFNGFYTGYRKTVMRPDELITAIEIPPVPGRQWFRKVGTRAAQAISKVVMAAVRAPRPRIAFGSVAPTVVRARRDRGRCWRPAARSTRPRRPCRPRSRRSTTSDRRPSTAGGSRAICFGPSGRKPHERTQEGSRQPARRPAVGRGPRPSTTVPRATSLTPVGRFRLGRLERRPPRRAPTGRSSTPARGRRARPESAPPRHYTDLRPHILFPGLVDTHAHVPQLPICGVHPENLLEWLRKWTFPLEKRFRGERALTLSRDFMHEMLVQGTTTAALYTSAWPDSVEACFTAAEEVGIHAWIGPPLMDEGAYRKVTTKRVLDEARALAKLDRPTLRFAVTPRFALSCTRELLEGCGALAREKHLPIQTHLAEQQAECQAVRERFGQEYLEVYEDAGLVTPRSLFAHAIWLTAREWQHLAPCAIAHCPTSNVFLGSGVMNWQRAQVARVGLGFGRRRRAGPLDVPRRPDVVDRAPARRPRAEPGGTPSHGDASAARRRSGSTTWAAWRRGRRPTSSCSTRGISCRPARRRPNRPKTCCRASCTAPDARR